jgi:hypothetical protein
MEREVPPEIRRYVTDEAKLADAEAELKKIWNRPRPVTDGQPDTAAVQLVRLRVCVMTTVPPCMFIAWYMQPRTSATVR